METGIQHKALSDTDYGSNYNEIFENNGPELDRQMPDINKLDIHFSSKSSSETNYGEENNKFFQDNALINGISRCSPVNKNFLTYQLDETWSIADFNMLQSSPLLLPSGQDHFYLTSTVNWEPASTREISIKVKKVESVRQVINTHFNLKARSWQVSAVIDITKRKKDMYAIAGINAGKNLVYQSISVDTKGSVLVILPTIALIKNLVCIAPKILYIYHLYSTVWLYTPDWPSRYCAHLKCLAWRS